MTTSLIPVLLLIAAALALSVGLIVAGRLLGPRRAGAVKQMPYESGMDPIHDTRRRFDVRFYLVAIAFLLFDVELLFLYPWAVARPSLLSSGEQADTGIEAAIRRQFVTGDGGIGRSASAPASIDPRVENEVSAQLRLVFAEVMVFIGLLALAFVYAWRKGVFQWR
jgi:NADH-quinone oxidoreductase subunit A